MNADIKFYQRLQGQNFLVSESAIEIIISALKLSYDEDVFEIGAGTGNITIPVSYCCKEIIAIEKDASLFLHLQKRAQRKKNIRAVYGDFFLTHELWEPSFNTPPHTSKIVSSMPFPYVESILARILFFHFELMVAVIGEKQLRKVKASFPELYQQYIFEKISDLSDNDFYPPQPFLSGSGKSKHVFIYSIQRREQSI